MLTCDGVCVADGGTGGASTLVTNRHRSKVCSAGSKTSMSWKPVFALDRDVEVLAVEADGRGTGERMGEIVGSRCGDVGGGVGAVEEDGRAL